MIRVRALTFLALVVIATSADAAPPYVKQWPQRSSGSGSISTITSTGGSLTVTNGTGPTTNLEVASTPTQASWSTDGLRIYAVDAVNGNDSNKGYADQADRLAANYPAACAAAGAVAEKTFAGLAAIFPKNGAGRQVEIVIANGGVNTVQNYAGTSTFGGLDTFLIGATGYARLVVRGTGTNTTAGAVAFDGSVGDVTYLGAVTGAGMNTTGYNPTGTPTTTQIQLTLVGGGSPSFPAEPGLPLGLRIRFDANTTTVALRNVARFIAQVPASDTVGITGTVLPATPVNSDVLYIEDAGVTTGSLSLSGGLMTQTVLMQFAGIKLTSSLNVRNTSLQLAFGGDTSLSVSNMTAFTMLQFYTHPVRGSVAVGAWRSSSSGTIVQPISALSLSQFGFAGGLTVANNFIAGPSSGGWVNGTLQFQQNFMSTVAAGVGQNGGAIGTYPRVINGHLVLINHLSQIDGLTITGAGSNPAIVLQGQNCNVNFNTSGQLVSGTTGNNDVGLDLTFATAATIVLNSTGGVPTVTGALGDIRLAGGQIISWANAAASGVVDASGNRFVYGPTLGSATTRPTRKILFSGTFNGQSGAAFTYLTDAGPSAANQTVALRRPTSGMLVVSVQLTSISDTLTHTLVFTLYKNGASTGITISIPGGTAANTKFVATSTQVFFGSADDFDVRLDDASADTGNSCFISGVVEYS